MNKKVLVIGASGMVASRYIYLAKDKLDIVPVDEKRLDITSKNSVKSFFEGQDFDSVVNFAAYTNVDAAEKERGTEGLVWNLNVEGVKNIIGVCKANNIFLVQISTDFVFPGDENFPGPYAEDTHPTESLTPKISWYGWTKRIAEKEVLESKLKAAIVRIAYPFRSDNFEGKKDWARKLLDLYNEDKLYPFFTDQTYSILSIDDLSEPLTKILDSKFTGIFHVVSKDTSSPYDVAKYLLERYSGKEIELMKGKISDFLKGEGRTPRPVFGGLQTGKTEEMLGLRFKTWKEMVDEFVKGIVKISK
jgi:dTDP-4-dehydrorhamnose reductase